VTGKTAFLHLGDAKRLRDGALIGAAAVSLALVLASAFGASIRPVNAGLVFLLLTLTVSATYGIWAGMAAAVVSNIALTYFFLEPIHHLWVSDPQHLGTLPVFIAISAVGSSLLATLRRLAIEAHRERDQAESLLRLNRAMIAQADPQSALQAFCGQALNTFNLRSAAILRAEDEGWKVIASAGEYDISSIPVAEPLGVRGSFSAGSTENDALPRVVPLETANRRVGALWLETRPGTPSEHSRALLHAFAGEATLAVSRWELARAAGQAEALRQADEVKTAILSSLAHDLKTPLATIKTSVTSLLDESVEWSDVDRTKFLESVGAESDRLERTISALVDLNRLESGGIKPVISSQSLPELVGEALQMAAGVLITRNVKVDVPDVEISTDASLVRHAVANLVENAAVYSRHDGGIRICAQSDREATHISVEDDGPGIDEDELPLIFHRFYKGRRRGRAGSSGLGLAIVKGFVTACGGSVGVESSPLATRFVISIPTRVNEA
jgi:two-component system sensor histidine kinase KdpD